MAGFDDTGLNPKPLGDIIEEFNTAYVQIYGIGFDTDPSTPDGQKIGVMSTNLAQLWDSMDGLYLALNPDTAQGFALDRVCQINYVSRLPGDKTEVDITVEGLPFQRIAADTIFGMSSNPDAAFTPEADYNLSATGEATFTVYSTEYAPITVGIGDIDKVISALPGIRNVYNTAAGTEGRVGETDAELRIRRNRSVSLIAKAHIESVEAQIAQVDNVTYVEGYENFTAIPDANGIPGRSIMMVVDGGVDALVAQAIRNSKPLGTGTAGNTTVTISGSDYSFERPTPVPIFLELDIVPQADYPTNGDDLVKEACVAFGETLGIGIDAWGLRFADAANDINGCEVVDVRIGTGATPTGTRVVIDFNELSTYDVANIVIAAVP